jgi:nicotinate-nucleotide pyrophosphorylase (carboxylating)
MAAAGGIAAAVAVRTRARHVDLEVGDTIEQVREAIDAGVALVLLDNMTTGEMQRRSHWPAPRPVRDSRRVADHLAARGGSRNRRDLFSVGALTHPPPA